MRVCTRPKGRAACASTPARVLPTVGGGDSSVSRDAAGQPDRGDMKSRFQGMRALTAGAVAGAMSAFWGVSALANDLVGQPTPGAIDLQPGVTPLRHDAIFFHNAILLPIITAITLFVLGLLVWVIVRYNRRANPTPARWSHNTLIEVIWTLAPVLILVFIAIFSFKLLF